MRERIGSRCAIARRSRSGGLLRYRGATHKRETTGSPCIEIIVCSRTSILAHPGLNHPATGEHNIALFYTLVQATLNCECTTPGSKLDELNDIRKAISHSLSV